MSERATPETCQNCARLQRYAETAWNRGHAMGMKANEDIARQATEALRSEKAAHADTNAMLTASLMDAERERDENEGAFRVWRRRCEEAERQRDALAEALRKVLPYMRVDTPNACEAFDTARALLAELEAKP